MDEELKVDKKRIGFGETGIFIRAKKDNKWGSYDISELTKESLLSWLKSRGGDNKWAENAVGILLGHGNLHA